MAGIKQIITESKYSINLGIFTLHIEIFDV